VERASLSGRPFLYAVQRITKRYPLAEKGSCKVLYKSFKNKYLVDVKSGATLAVDKGNSRSGLPSTASRLAPATTPKRRVHPSKGGRRRMGIRISGDWMSGVCRRNRDRLHKLRDRYATSDSGPGRGISNLDLEANAEAERLVEVRKRTTELKTSVDDLRGQSVKLKVRLQGEKSRKQKLEMAVFKKRLKSCERLVSA